MWTLRPDCRPNGGTPRWLKRTRCGVRPDPRIGTGNRITAARISNDKPYVNRTPVRVNIIWLWGGPSIRSYAITIPAPYTNNPPSVAAIHSPNLLYHPMNSRLISRKRTNSLKPRLRFCAQNWLPKTPRGVIPSNLTIDIHRVQPAIPRYYRFRRRLRRIKPVIGPPDDSPGKESAAKEGEPPPSSQPPTSKITRPNRRSWSRAMGKRTWRGRRPGLRRAKWRRRRWTVRAKQINRQETILALITIEVYMRSSRRNVDRSAPGLDLPAVERRHITLNVSNDLEVIFTVSTCN